MPEVATICFHTRDAVEREDSALTFEMPAHRLPVQQATKVALASCEFPMVQHTIEPEWNRLWICEGIHISAHATLEVVSHSNGDLEESRPVRLTLPPRINQVVSSVRRGRWLEVECADPHGLAGAGGAPMDIGDANDAPRVFTATGIDAPISNFEALTPTRFACSPLAGTTGGEDAVYVVSPVCAGPHVLCAWLTQSARGAIPGLRLQFVYDALEDMIRLRVTADGAPDGTIFRVVPTSLAHTCGISTASVRVGGAGSREVPSVQTSLWDYIEAPVGFYAPCHRPMCTGQPLRFGSELEAAANRFYFPLGPPPSALPNATTPHLLVFSSPDGDICIAEVPCGRYTPDGLCSHLETAMASAIPKGSATPCAFTVWRDVRNRFCIACEKKGPSGIVQPATFGLLFHHPLNLDPERLGFAAQPLSGAHTYVAPTPTRVASVAVVGDGAPKHVRVASNVLRVAEVVSQKRFQVHGSAPPSMVATVEAVTASRVGGGAVMVLRTLVNNNLFAHGFQPGDVVQVGAPSGGARAPVWGVVSSLGKEATVVCVHAMRGAAAADDVLALTTPAPMPWNLCFCKPRTLPAHLVGFRPRAVLWGKDGSVEDGEGRARPPFEAPYTHCLDHPDYVLMTLSEAGGAGLVHIHRGEVKHIFCKLTLYPLFREERMLPRDTTLLHSHLSRFTLCFWNPDFTPYRFHGAEFSFSLNFYS